MALKAGGSGQWKPGTSSVNVRRTLWVIGTRPLSAAVRQFGGGLEQDQAASRISAVGATTVSLENDLSVVEIGSIALEAQAEAGLAVRSAVARALVAAEPGERRHHL